MKNLFTIIDNNTKYTLGKYINNQIIYDFNSTLEYIDAKGKECFGKHFKIYKEDHPLIYKLMIYTIKDQKACTEKGINLNKGILLTGPVGCGKTTLMQLIPCITPQFRKYNLFPTRNIVFAFNAIGYDIIEQYTKEPTCCFDDLGAEPTGRHFGHDCNVMAEILTSRYESFNKNQLKSNNINQAQLPLNNQANLNLTFNIPSHQKTKHIHKLTHLTSNLNATEIEVRYGTRVRSRLREMVNVLAFPANSIDKRT